MAGNSVPAFFGSKGRTKRPPGLDVTFITDISGSMGPFRDFITARATASALETELLNQGIGKLSPNRYSYTIGADTSNNTLTEIEKFVTVNGVSTRWAPGENILNGTATIPVLGGGGRTEDVSLATNLVSDNDRTYLTANQRIVVVGSDEQSPGPNTPFNASPAFNYIYVGVHSVLLSIAAPSGPNPTPAGILVGFVYTTNTTGTGIYVDGTTINYQESVPVSSVTATATSNTIQQNVDQAKLKNGAIYNIQFYANKSFDTLGTSLGRVLGQFLFDAS